MRLSVAIDHGQHAQAGASVLVAVNPGDGQKVRHLPEEQNQEQNAGFTGDLAAHGAPADDRRQRPGTAPTSVFSGVSLFSGVYTATYKMNVSAATSAAVMWLSVTARYSTPPRPSSRPKTKHFQGLQASRRQGAFLRAAHPRVAVAFEPLIEGAGAGRHERGAENGVQQDHKREVSTAGQQHAGADGEQHEHGHARLGQLDIVRHARTRQGGSFGTVDDGRLHTVPSS